ncbi:MAG: signal peptidase I [Planctomycetota bacterium]
MPDDQPDDQPDTTAETTPVSTAPVRGGRRGRKGRKNKKPKKKYDSILGYLWGEWIRPLGIIFVIMGVFRLVAFDWFDVPTGSMEPTIMVGDRIAVHKWAYGIRVPFTKETWIVKWDRPVRGDIVVCHSPDEGDEVRLVKRIVAQPGDIIEMREGLLVINGEPAEYADADQSLFDHIDPIRVATFDFLVETVDEDGNGPGYSHTIMLDETPKSIRNFPPIEVPEDQYVMIGDNRDHSKDSRAWNLEQPEYGRRIGFIGHERIQGRAFAVAFSLDKNGGIWTPRWNRFFKRLD